MNLESSLNQSIDTVQTLSETNSLLINMVENGIGEVLDSTKKYMELINHCGKIYEYLNKKNDKTWEETESLKILYRLITGSDQLENTPNKA